MIHLLCLLLLPPVVDTPIERIERGKHRTNWESKHNADALKARLKWAQAQNARLRADGVIWITPKHRRKKRG